MFTFSHSHSQELTRALGQVKLHVFIQCYTLVFIPLAVTLMVKTLGITGVLDEMFLSGYVACPLENVYTLET